MSHQASFEELIAGYSSSNISLDRNHNQSLGIFPNEELKNQGRQQISLTSKAASNDVGIDDFLARYRHQQSSIRDFFSCLDEPTASLKMERNFISSVRNFEVKMSVSSKDCKARESEGCTFSSAGDNHGQCNGSHGSKKSIPSGQGICKRRKKLTSEEREERRREQNREAQRRFRERHMLQSSLQSLHSQHGVFSFSRTGALTSRPLPSVHKHANAQYPPS
jgi:hypothetical protein